MGGLEAIVRNLDSMKEQEDTFKEQQADLIKQLNCHLYLLYLDAVGSIWVWSQGDKLLQEVDVAGEEKEEEEQVRLRACVLYPQFQTILMQTIHV